MTAFFLLIISQRTLCVSAANGDIASGKDKNITWVIDGNGKLTVKGTGDFTNGAPWDAYRLRITSATVQVTGMTDASEFFSGCSNLKSVDLSGFDTSRVKNMKLMFDTCSSLSNLDLSHFNTANVTNMIGMFSGCSSLTSLNLNNFNTTNVTDMRSMFNACNNLSVLNIDHFDTSNVGYMAFMFRGCGNLISLNLNHFNTSKVTSMESMFDSCNSLISLNISHFNTSKVEHMYRMFANCNSLSSLDLSHFDTSNVFAHNILYGCFNLTTIYTPYNLKTSVILPTKSGEVWYLADGTEITELPKNLSGSVKITRSQNTGNIASGTSNNITWIIDEKGKLTVNGTGDYVRSTNSSSAPWSSYSGSIISAEINVTGMTDASFMFAGCGNLISLNLSDFDTSTITNMERMFSGCGIQYLDLSNFDTSNVTNMKEMFYTCNSSSIDLSSFNTKNVTNMSNMFSWNDSLLNLDLSSFNTENVTDMSHMFEECEILRNLNLSSFNTKNVTNMSNMFAACVGITSLDLNSFNTENVTDMSHMFENCGSLKKLNLSSFDMLSVKNTKNMLSYCRNLISISTPLNLIHYLELPGTGWKLPDGTEITELPIDDLEHSITITRELPDIIEDNDNNNNQPDNDSNNNNDTSTPTPDNPESDNPTWIGDKDTEPNGSSSGTLEGTGSTEDITSYGPRLLTITPTAYNKIQLSWDAVPGAKSYEIFYSTSPDSGYKRLANVKKTFYRFSRAKCGITYYFQMRVCQKGAKSAFGPVSYGKTELTGSPSLQIKKTSYNSVTLKWSKVAGAKKYEIFYADSLDGEWHSLGLKGGTSFTHKKLMTGATYYYQIRPIRDSFYGRWSNGVSTTTFLDNVNKLKVKAASADRMKLTWKKVKGAAYYVILRADSIDGTYEMIAHATKSSYIDTGLQSGTTYFYKVYAVSGPYKTKETAPVGQTTKIAKK